MNLIDFDELYNSLKMSRRLVGERPVSGLSELYDAVFLKYIFPIIDCSRIQLSDPSWPLQDEITALNDSPIRGFYVRAFKSQFQDLVFSVRDEPVKSNSTLSYMDCARICHSYISVGFVNVSEEDRKKFLENLGGAIELYFETFQDHDDYVVLASIAIECAKRGGVPLEWIIDIVSPINHNATLELIHAKHAIQDQISEVVNNIRKFEL